MVLQIFEKTTIKNALLRICEKRKINPRNKNRVGEVYDLLVSEVELAWRRKLNLIILRVPPPESFTTYPTPLIGVPLAYVVKEKRYITISQILNERGEDLT